MDRRSFSRLALSGLGLLAMPKSVAMADVMAPTPVPPTPQPYVPPRPEPLGYQPLLDRARAALERHGHTIPFRDRVGLADFSRASSEPRFHIVDMVTGRSTSCLVAHGRGSDPGHSGWLQRFSNEPGSLATSSGAYRTGEFYHGIHGQAMRLIGLEPQNYNAESRAIVVHGADYVSENHIAQWGKLGRSEGCFAVAHHILPEVLALLGPGRLIYADKI